MECGLMVRKMAKEFIPLQMGHHIVEIGKMMRKLDLEHLDTKMEKRIRGNVLMVNKMVKVIQIKEFILIFKGVYKYNNNDTYEGEFQND